MIKVLIADDHPIILEGLKALLEFEDNIQVVGVANNGRQVLDFLKKQEVDVLLLDLDMPIMNGMETAKILRKDFPRIQIIVLTMSSEKRFILDLMSLGIAGYILKSKSSDEVVEAINRVFSGKKHFKEEVIEAASASKGSGAMFPVKLTNRENEILSLIGACKTTKQIADELFISNTTVETHIRNILAKLELESRMHLVRYAVENGYTK